MLCYKACVTKKDYHLLTFLPVSISVLLVFSLSKPQTLANFMVPATCGTVETSFCAPSNIQDVNINSLPFHWIVHPLNSQFIKLRPSMIIVSALYDLLITRISGGPARWSSSRKKKLALVVI